MIRLLIQRLKSVIVVMVRLVVEPLKWLAAIGGVTAAATHPGATTDLFHSVEGLAHEAAIAVFAVLTVIEAVRWNLRRMNDRRNVEDRRTTARLRRLEPGMRSLRKVKHPLPRHRGR